MTTAGSYDAAASVAASSAWIMQLVAFRVPNLAPTLSSPGNQTSAESAVIALPVVASDPDGDPVTFSATGLPPVLTIDPSTGVISGTLTATSVGTYPVTVTASDGTLTASQSFTWTVTKVQRPPVLSAISDRTDSVNATVSLQLVATDPDGDALTYIVAGLPVGVTVNPYTGLISGTLSSAGAGMHAVTATVSDGTLANSQTFAWTVTGTPPVLTAVGNLSTTPGFAVMVQLSASDADGDLVTYGAVGLPPGLSVNAQTGLISGTPSTAGVYAVTATAFAGGLSSSQSFTWTVVVPLATPTPTLVQHAAWQSNENFESRQRLQALSAK